MTVAVGARDLRERLVRLAESGRVDLERMVFRRIGLDADEITAAFAVDRAVRTVNPP